MVVVVLVRPVIHCELDVHVLGVHNLQEREVGLARLELAQVESVCVLKQERNERQACGCDVALTSGQRRGTHQRRYEVAVIDADQFHVSRLLQDVEHAVRGAVQQDAGLVRRVDLLQELPGNRRDAWYLVLSW